MNRREFIASFLAIAATAPGQAHAGGPTHNISRELSREVAKGYAYGKGDKRNFNHLFDLQSAFHGLKAWPATNLVVSDAVSALRRVLHGETIDRLGFRRVQRRPATEKVVVFSDHHIFADGHRQAGVWTANRKAYVRVLEHYAKEGYTVSENGDVEDLVILDPEVTLGIYEEVLASRNKRNWKPYAIVEWFREDPFALQEALTLSRRVRRQAQLDKVMSLPGNQEYYALLERLAAAKQLVRVAGNHDYDLQFLRVPPHLRPVDILLIDTPNPFAIMHGHQFDEATNPAVAAFSGEVISECLGVWYQGPDRTWSARFTEKILAGGFPNRLSTHPQHSGGGMVGHMVTALLSNSNADDEEWARAWESLFGHPIAWEYGSSDWTAAVRGAWAQPAHLMDEAMAGKQFFKYRHLDEWQIVQQMQLWGLHVSLVLGHSHEVRHHKFGHLTSNYYNSGSAGRFFNLLWALEIIDGEVAVVGWHIQRDGKVARWVFELRDYELFNYFVPHREGAIL